MFDPNSRYYKIDDAIHRSVEPDGSERQLAYKRRRFLPPAEQIALLTEHVSAAGDRLDNLSMLYLQDPALSHHICDANDVLHPRDLLAQVGRRIRIGLVVR